MRRTLRRRFIPIVGEICREVEGEAAYTIKRVTDKTVQAIVNDDEKAIRFWALEVFAIAFNSGNLIREKEAPQSSVSV